MITSSIHSLMWCHGCSRSSGYSRFSPLSHVFQLFLEVLSSQGDIYNHSIEFWLCPGLLPVGENWKNATGSCQCTVFKQTTMNSDLEVLTLIPAQSCSTPHHGFTLTSCPEISQTGWETRGNFASNTHWETCLTLCWYCYRLKFPYRWSKNAWAAVDQWVELVDWWSEGRIPAPLGAVPPKPFGGPKQNLIWGPPPTTAESPVQLLTQMNWLIHSFIHLCHLFNSLFI